MFSKSCLPIFWLLDSSNKSSTAPPVCCDLQQQWMVPIKVNDPSLPSDLKPQLTSSIGTKSMVPRRSSQNIRQPVPANPPNYATILSTLHATFRTGGNRFFLTNAFQTARRSFFAPGNPGQNHALADWSATSFRGFQIGQGAQNNQLLNIQMNEHIDIEMIAAWDQRL